MAEPSAVHRRRLQTGAGGNRMIPLMPLMSEKATTRRRLKIVTATVLVIALAVGSVMTVRAYQRDQAKLRAARHVLARSLAHETRLHGRIDGAHAATQAANAATAARHRGTHNEHLSTQH